MTEQHYGSEVKAATDLFFCNPNPNIKMKPIIRKEKKNVVWGLGSIQQLLIEQSQI